MRLVHLADLHLGYRQYQRQTPTGINQREADVARVFAKVIDEIIAMRPDLVVIAGDVFHHVRPSNPAILHAFALFSRLRAETPDTIVAMIAGNHDTPRSSETGYILRLFEPLGVHVVEAGVRRLTFPERDLAILMVPDAAGEHFVLEPDAGFKYNVLVFHGEVDGLIPEGALLPDRALNRVGRDAIRPEKWGYVALGHHHVFSGWEGHRNANYTGSLDYTSANIWGELYEEKLKKLDGKVFISYDLDKQERVVHRVPGERRFIDLPWIEARGRTAADIDADIAGNVDRVRKGIDGCVLRQVVKDLPRHVARELDHRAIREIKRRAMHFYLDGRRPETIRRIGPNETVRRATLEERVRDYLRSRPVSSDVDVDALVTLGTEYLRQADSGDPGQRAADVE